MGSVPFALSIHHFINSVGADAGFASIIGLALLVLLYFAHARETATLRDRADADAQRIADLETRIVALSQAQAIQAAQAQQAQLVTGGLRPVPAPAVAVRPSGVAALTARVPVGAVAGAATVTPRPLRPVMPEPVGAPPSAPAGVAAPALSAATKLIPSPAPAPPGNGPAQPAPAPPGDTPTDSPAILSPPATVAGGSNGHVSDPPDIGESALAAATAAAAAPPLVTPPPVTPPPVSATQPPVSRSRAAPPRVQIREATQPPRRPLTPLRPPATRQPSVGRRIVIGLIGLIALALGIAALLILTNNGTDNTNNAGRSRTTNSPGSGKHHKGTSTFVPSSVTVAVLNGTAVNGLAARVGVELLKFGYREGTVATAIDQTHTATVVEYLPGHRSDASHVASSLKLKPGATTVQPIDSATQQVACPPPAPCAANVVVTIGADLSSTT